METSATTVFGLHYMLDGYGANPEVLRDVKKLRELLVDLPKQLELHAISDPVVVEVGPNNKKDPGGLSGFLLVAESHISFHTFPKRKFVTIDAYTCNDTLNESALTQLFTEFFLLEDSSVQIIERGTYYPVTDQTT